MNRTLTAAEFQIIGSIEQPIPLGVNQFLIKECAEKYGLSLIDIHKQYIEAFDEVRHSTDTLEYFTLNDKVIKEVLSQESKLRSLGCSTELIYVLSKPPINFYDKHYTGRVVSDLGKIYLNFINDNFDRYEKLTQPYIDYLLSSDFNIGHFNEFDSFQLSSKEKGLVFLSWLNKHFKLVDDDLLKGARYNFALSLFKAIVLNSVKTNINSRHQKVLNDINNRIYTAQEQCKRANKSLNKMRRKGATEQQIAQKIQDIESAEANKKQLQQELSSKKEEFKKEKDLVLQKTLDDLDKRRINILK